MNLATKKYEGRLVTRASEEASLSKAVMILKSDRAFNNQALNPTSFLQIATKDPFATVLSEIEKMLLVIDDEDKDDTDKKTWCEGENKTNEERLKKAGQDKEVEIGEIAKHKGRKEQAEQDLSNAQTEIKLLQTELQTTKENRKEEHKQYQNSIVELKDAQEMLKKAIHVLQQFYDSEEKKASEQDHDFKQQDGASVISLLEGITTDTAKSEESAHSDEQEAQKNYELDMQTTLVAIQAQKEEVLTQEGIVADAEEKILAAETAKAGFEKIEAQITAYKASIKDGCDFIIDNYVERSKKRSHEKSQLNVLKTKLEERQTAHAA